MLQCFTRELISYLIERWRALWLASLASSTLALSPAAATPALKSVAPDAMPTFTQAVPLQLGGRTQRDALGFTSGWPGIYAEARFRGQSALIGPISGRSRWRVFLDDVDIGILNTLVAPVFVIEGLSANMHTIRLERVDEDRFSIVQIAGVFVPADAQVLSPPRPKTRQIEFIGDSFMTGFALSAASLECTDERIWETTDTGLAWPVLVAKTLDADYQVNAYSGAGFARNFAYQRAMLPMPSLYDRLLPASREPYQRPDTWRPDLIIVALGENDFEPPFLSGEVPSSAEAVQKAVVPAIVSFVRHLRRANPSARIVLLDYGHLPSRNGHSAAIPNLTSEDRSRVSMLSMERDFGLTGCYGHLDTRDHRRIAERVLRFL